jgi:hypothetical protein
VGPAARERQGLDDAERADRAAAADCGEDRLAVAAQALREEVAHPAGEVARPARAHVDRPQPPVVGGRVRRQQPGAVRRPRDRIDTGAGLREPTRLAGARVEEPHVAPAAGKEPAERDAARPPHREHGAVVAREPASPPGLDVEDLEIAAGLVDAVEDDPAPVRGEARIAGAGEMRIARPRERPRAAGFEVDEDERPQLHDRDPARGRRPDEPGDEAVITGRAPDGARLLAGDRHDVELVLGARVGDQPSVRRELRVVSLHEPHPVRPVRPGAPDPRMLPADARRHRVDELRPPDRAVASAPGCDDEQPGGEHGAAHVQS